MTLAELRSKVYTLLYSDLGTYTYPPGSSPATGPAFVVGEPPADVQALGLEVVIEQDPELIHRPTHQRAVSVTAVYRVRLIRRSPGPLQAPLRRMISAFPTASVTPIPANAAIGILSQVLVEVPTS